jgi:hypothetical protein
LLISRLRKLLVLLFALAATGWQAPLTVTTLPGTHGSVVDSAEFTDSIRRFIQSVFWVP